MEVPQQFPNYNVDSTLRIEYFFHFRARLQQAVY